MKSVRRIVDAPKYGDKLFVSCVNYIMTHDLHIRTLRHLTVRQVHNLKWGLYGAPHETAYLKPWNGPIAF